MNNILEFGKLNRYSSHISFFIYCLKNKKFFIENYGFSKKRITQYEEEINSILNGENKKLKVVNYEFEEMSFSLVIDKNDFKKSDELREDFLSLCELFSLKITCRLDSATSLNNKKSFINELDKRIGELKIIEDEEDYINIFSGKIDKSLSLIMFDIDHFKKFNDDYGHLIGDMVIYKVALTLRKIAEKYNGFAARYGGEEFSLIIDSSDSKYIEQIAEEIRKNILELRLSDEENREIRQISVSLGFSSVFSNINSEEIHFLRDNLIIEADMALYTAKRNGRNQTFMFSKIKNSEGKIIEKISNEYFITSLGFKHNIKAGNKFKVIHKDFNGKKAIIDSQTKKKIGNSPLIIKGLIEIITPGVLNDNSMGNMISIGMVKKLNQGFNIEKGDYLIYEPEFPEFIVEDNFELDNSLVSEKLERSNSIINRYNKKKESLFILKVNKFESRKRGIGIFSFQKTLDNIKKSFLNIDIKLIGISSDKAVFFLKNSEKSVLKKIEKIMLKYDLHILTVENKFPLDEDNFKLLKSIVQITFLDNHIVFINFDHIIKFAASFYKLKDYETAWWILEKFEKNLSKKSMFHNLMGGLNFQKRNFKEARSNFKKAVELDDKNFYNWMNYGIVSLNLNKLKESGTSFKEALKINKKSPQANNNYAYFLLLSGGDSEIALKFAKNGVKYSENNRATVLYKDTVAHALIKLERYNEAVEILETISSQRDDVIDIFIHLYEALMKLEKKEKAKIYYKIIEKMAPNHPILK